MSSRTSRCAPLRPTPGTRMSAVPRRRPPLGAASRAGAEQRQGEPRADAGHGLHDLEHLRSSSSAKPNSVSGPRAPPRSSQSMALRPNGSAVAGVHCTVKPTAPTSITTLVGRRGDRAADEGDHRAAATARASRSWASPRHRWQIAMASASAASAGRGVGQAEQPSHHGGHLVLVGAAVAGDRGLDLGGRVQRHRDAARPASRPMAAAWAVPMTVRTLCWLKTRSTATASGANSSTRASRPAWTWASRRSMDRSGSVRMTPM